MIFLFFDILRHHTLRCSYSHTSSGGVVLLLHNRMQLMHRLLILGLANTSNSCWMFSNSLFFVLICTKNIHIK